MAGALAYEIPASAEFVVIVKLGDVGCLDRLGRAVGIYVGYGLQDGGLLIGYGKLNLVECAVVVA